MHFLQYSFYYGYMYNAGRKSCLELIEKGFVNAFEEILELTDINRTVRDQAELGNVKRMPPDIREDTKTMNFIMESLVKAEDAVRAGDLKGNYDMRMELGEYFHNINDYHWLAKYFYKSCYQISGNRTGEEAKLPISALEKLGLLEEQKSNMETALHFMEKAIRIADENDLPDDDASRQQLYLHLIRIYRKLGSLISDKEDYSVTKKSKSVRYFKKAASLAKKGTIESQAVSFGMLGRTRMKFNDFKNALEDFESYNALCDKCNDQYGVCNGYFALSDIHKRIGNIDESKAAAEKCQELAKEYMFEIPYIFSAISLGQISTAQRNYRKAHEQFETAYRIFLSSKKDYAKAAELHKLCKIMCGIGRAHLSFNKLIKVLQEPEELALIQITDWRNKGGIFKGDIMDRNDHLIDLEEKEKIESESKISVLIEKLTQKELSNDI